MTGSKIQKFDLFKAAIGNNDYLTAITKSTTSQADFIQTIEEGHLTHQDILESIQLVQNQQVKSLLIIYLLSQKDYIARLNGSPLLSRLATLERHIPSRLNALIHQLDLKTLTTTMIGKLEPEAAISILCSVPHFHQLTNEQTEALIQKYPEHELIRYWMNHYASMPNAHYTLAHLIKYAGSLVITELLKMESNQKEAILVKIIEHLELFNDAHRFMKLANKEPHLILAIRLYLNGHYNKAYATYINQLAKKLVDKNHSFSTQAIELLFFLNDKLEFKELVHKTAYLTNRYLRNNAQEGNIDLFYQNNQIHIKRMIQSVFLNHHYPEASNELESTYESALIDEIKTRNKRVNCFEYFLIHYKGSSEPLSKILNDYMDFYARAENAKNRSQAIHHLGFMLIRPELDISVKEALFDAFLNHPVFFDEQISPHLFLFDTKRVIRYFGLRGGEKNYRVVIDLCTIALKKLHSNQNQEIIQIAQKALAEATLELNFSQQQGLFASLVKLIKRCWIYGWSGFFKPNSPDYVAPESLDLEEHKRKSPTKGEKKYILQPPERKDLPTLLEEIEYPLSQATFEDLIEALALYSFQAIPQEEFATRQRLQIIYHQAIESDSKKELHYWLKNNQIPFIINQFRLLELALKENSHKNLDSLIAQINEGSDQLEYITAELNSIMPELIATKEPEDGVFMTCTTKGLSGYVYEATGYAQNALGWAKNKACRFFEEMKKPNEETVFEVEHIPNFRPTNNQI